MNLSLSLGERGSAFLNALPIIAWTNRPDGWVEVFNEAWYGFTGLSAEDSLGYRWKAAIHPEDVPACRAAWEAAVRAGEPCEFEFRLRRRDGAYRWTRGRVTPLRDGEGVLERWIGALLDIDDLKRSMQRGMISEERLRRFVESEVIGIIIARNDGSVVEANEALLRMVGYTRAELEAGELDWRALTPPEWLYLDERAIAELDSAGVFRPYQKEYFRKDNTRVPILLGGARVSGTTEQVCYVLDVTAEKRADRERALSEARYHALAESLPHMIIQTDAAGTVTYISPHWHEYTGSSDYLGLESRRAAVHPDDLPNIDRLRESGGSYEAEIRLRRADGIYRWHLVRVRQIADASGVNVGRIASMFDIDARKRFEKTLRLLSSAGNALGRSLGLQATLDALLRLVVPDIGDWASINVREADGRIHALAALHADSRKAHLTESLRNAFYYNESASVGTPSVYRTKRPARLDRIEPEILAATVKPEFAEVFVQMGLGPFLAMPIMLDGEVIGTIGIGSEAGRAPFSEDEVAQLEQLCERAAFSIANAQAYEREHFVAESFQKAALPTRLPSVPGLRLDSYYQSAASESIVGGDWYDAFVLDGGLLAISIGDVSGNGISAALQMAAVRQTLRGVAQVSPDPFTMLEAADRAVRAEGDSRMVTAFAAVIDPSDGMTMRYACAGHPPALVRRADGTIEELRTGGLPLGYRHLHAGSMQKTKLEAGSSLVLFTDGLVEASHNIVAGEAAVREAVRALDWDNCAKPAMELSARILGGVATRDDIAVLTVCSLR